MTTIPSPSPRRTQHRRVHMGSLAPTVLAVSTCIACSHSHPLAPPAAPLTPPARLCGDEDADTDCWQADDVELWLKADKLNILGMTEPPSGTQGAKVVTLEIEEAGMRFVFRAKWRPQSSAGFINEPRKELAAYAVQKLFLDPSAYVVPPTAAHCFPLSQYRRFVPQAEASFLHTDCVFGFVSYWLENVHTVESAEDEDLIDGDDSIWDPERFETDRVYRSSVARANLLTYAINHGDMHELQFLVEPTPKGLRAYVVDNSIAFLSIKNPMLLFREDWSELQVPAVPTITLSRLRALSAADYGSLATIARFEQRGKSLYQVMHPPPGDEEPTAISWNGSELRVGLTQKEIDLVRARLANLLRDGRLEPSPPVEPGSVSRTAPTTGPLEPLAGFPLLL